MAPAIDTHAQANNSSVTSISVTITTTNATDVILAFVGMNSTESSITVSSPTLGNFTKRATSGNSKLYEFYAISSTTLTNETITLSVGTAATLRLNVIAISGANTSAPFDANLSSPVQSNGSSTAPSASVTTTDTTDMIIGAIWSSGAPSFTVGSGYTQLDVNSNSPLLATEYESVTSAKTSFAVNGTLSVTETWYVIADAITSGSGSGGGGGTSGPTNFLYFGVDNNYSSLDTQSFANTLASQCLQWIRTSLNSNTNSQNFAQLFLNAGIDIIALAGGSNPESSPGVLMPEATFKAGVQAIISAFPGVHVWEFGNEIQFYWNNISPQHYFQGLVWFYEVVINTAGHANDTILAGGTETIFTSASSGVWDGYDGCNSSSCVDGWSGSSSDKIGFFKTFWGLSITDSFGTWTPAKIISYIPLHVYTNGATNLMGNTIGGSGPYSTKTYGQMLSDALNVYYQVAGSSTKIILTEFGAATNPTASSVTPTTQTNFMEDAVTNFFQLSSVSSIVVGAFYYTLIDDSSSATDGLFTNPSLSAKSSWDTWSGILCANGSTGNTNPPTLVITPSSGPVGTVANWTLTNGPASTAVVSEFDGNTSPPANTSSSGGLTGSITISSGTAPGQYLLLIVNNSTQQQIVSAFFTVTGTVQQTGPSSVPAVTPRARTGTVGRYRVFLNGMELNGWETVQTDNTLDMSLNKATIQFPDLVSMKYALQGIGEPVFADVLITRDGQYLWRGFVQHRTRYISGSSTSQHRRYVLTCVSNKSYLEREAFRYTGHGSEGGNQSSQPYFDVIYGGAIAQTTQIASNGSTLATNVFQDILNCQKSAILSAGLVGANNPNGRNPSLQTPHVCLYMIKTYAMQALAQLINASLWEARFNPDNTVDFQNQTGSLTSVVTFNEGDNLIDAQEDYGVDNLVNDVVVLGAGSAQPNPFSSTITDYGLSAEVDNSPANGPRYTKFYSMSNIYDTNLLQTYANALSTDLQYSMFSYPLTVVDRLPGVNWHLGDVITLNSPTLGISNALYRIQKEQRAFDSQNQEQITLLAMPEIHEASIAHTRARALEYLLNSQTMNGQLFQNTVPTQGQPQQYPTSVNLPQNENIYRIGVSGTFDVYTYGRIALNGLSNGAIFYATPVAAGSLTLNYLQAIDLDNNSKIYSIQNSPVTGTQYSATTTDDIYDHCIALDLNYTLTTSFTGPVQVSGILQALNPSLPN